MGRKNSHGIRVKAKGGGKKWRPSPNDPALTPPAKPHQQTEWGSVDEVLRRRR